MVFLAMFDSSAASHTQAGVALMLLSVQMSVGCPVMCSAAVTWGVMMMMVLMLNPS